MKSLRARFSILTVIVVIVSVAATGFLSVHLIKRLSNDYADNLIRLSCNDNSKELDTYLKGIEQCVDSVAYYASTGIEELSPEEIAESCDVMEQMFNTEANSTRGVISYFFHITPEVDESQGFWFAKTNGVLFEEADPTDLSQYDPGDTEVAWYYIPREKSRAVWIDPYVDEGMGVKMITYVAPVIRQGRFIGVVGIDYDYDALQTHLSYSGAFEGEYSFLVNANEEIISHPDVESGTPVSEISDKLCPEHLSDSDKTISYEYDGRKERASWSELSNGMILYLSVPESEIDSIWKRMLTYFVFAALAIILVFSVITAVMAGQVTRPLSKLTEAAKKVGEGDYDIDLDIQGDDEIGLLAGAFRQLTERLKAHISDLNDMAYKDALTSVKNKAALDMFMSKLQDRISSSDEDSRPEFAICMFDCNWLKDINDNYGHDKGDIYLKKACGLICKTFRHSPVFRLGGDEFVCVLQNEDYTNRRELCMQFDRDTVRISEENEEQWEKINMASGIAVFDPERGDSSVEDVYRRADARMYEDKIRKKQGIIRDLTDELVSY